MAQQIGKIAAKEATTSILERAKMRSAFLPDLLSEAQQIVSNVISGWHGRKKRGIGENFWQFRPYAEGEDFTKIDWRRSARDDQTYVKDLEWEAVHTFWVWTKLSSSMAYQSNLTSTSKQSRALVLGFAIIELLARSGERVGWPSISNTIASRNAAEQIAMALSHQLDNAQAHTVVDKHWPDTADIQAHSQMVIISDFLDPIDDLIAKFDDLFARGAKAYLIHIIDPAEQVFPYNGRTEFLDPATGERYMAGDAAELTEKYRAQFNARIEILQSHSARLGWGYTVHHTDKLASSALISLHGHLTGNFDISANQTRGVK